MKQIDVNKLAWLEMKLDQRNMVLAFVLNISLFLNIIVILLFSTELDVTFDIYCHKNISDVYSAEIYHIDETVWKDLKQDGFQGDGELFYDEEKKQLFTFADIASLENLDFKLIKWRFRGVIIKMDMQEIVGIIILIKSVFVFISILGATLCFLAMGNFYQMKAQKRVPYTNMLIRLGVPAAKIGQIYRMPFLWIESISILISYILSFPLMSYYNTLIRKGFDGITISTEKRGMVTVGLYIIVTLFLYLILGNRWKKLDRE